MQTKDADTNPLHQGQIPAAKLQAKRQGATDLHGVFLWMDHQGLQEKIRSMRNSYVLIQSRKIHPPFHC